MKTLKSYPFEIILESGDISTGPRWDAVESPAGLGAHGATHFIHPATCLPSAVPATSALGQRTALSWRPDCRAGTTRQRTSGWGSSALTTRQPCVSIAPSCFLLGAGSGFALELKVLFEVTDMNFCWACPKSAWKTCGQLPWTGPRPLPAALPEFLGAVAVGDWGAKQQGPVTVHVTCQDSTGEATCGLPSFHLHGPTSCCLSHQLPLAGQWMAGSCPGRGPEGHSGVWDTHGKPGWQRPRGPGMPAPGAFLHLLRLRPQNCPSGHRGFRWFGARG